MNENRFYVYLHKIKETGEIFYVGKGTKYRLTSNYGRSKTWKEITKINEWIAEKYAENLSQSDAEDIELKLILSIKPKANIHRTLLRKKKLDMEFLSKRYEYSEDSKTGLVYKEWNGQCGEKRRNAGEPAGTINGNGYYTVYSKGNGNVMLHRVVWALINNEDPQDMIIDHIDGCRLNNKIENLRKVTILENNQNMSLRKDNKTGVVGVQLQKNGFYSATWKDSDMNSFSKTISVAKFGNELAFALACYYRAFMVSGNKVMTERHKGDLFKYEILDKYSHEQIMEMVNCDIIATNTSGVPNIYRTKAGSSIFWEFWKGNYRVRFSAFRYTEEVAKNLAIEARRRFLGGDILAVNGLSMEDTNKIISDRENKMNKEKIWHLN